MQHEKEIRWVGSTYDDLVKFPDEPRRDAGFQLSKVQAGLEPEDWRSFDDVGAGTRDKDIATARYRAVVKARRGRP